MVSLWGDEFEVKKPEPKKILDKIKKPKTIKSVVKKTTRKSKKLSLDEQLAAIEKEVYRILGVYRDNTIIISDKEEFISYIDKAIENGIISIDTETNNSLDPVTCKLMGPCIYTPGKLAAYIPVNHINKDTRERLDWQLDEEFIGEQFNRLTAANVKIITQNGKFDYQVLKCTSNYELQVYWDTLIGTKLLDENIKDAGLKNQYITLIDPSIEKYDIDDLFEGVEYAVVDPKIFSLYAAPDALMTYKLYEYQMGEFMKPENEGLLNLALKIEMPLVNVIGDLELNGMKVDLEYAALLHEKYHKKLDEVELAVKAELDKLKPQIDAWRQTPDANYHKPLEAGHFAKSKSEQLTDPINLGSPTQLAILFYDILKAPVVNKSKPRSVGEDDIKAIAEKLNISFTDVLLERRELVKLLTTYIDPIPELSNRWPDHRVRTHFNAYGAVTGRLSSAKPLNFQNIPSHNKEIRMLFKADDGCRIIGGDFSAQEPRLTAFYSQDKAMIDAYTQGKDLYSVIASMSFGFPYEDCLEFYPEGTKIIYEGSEVICGHKTHLNVAGKNRRAQAKSILLGLLYGRGAASIGEQIGKGRDEAQQIIDNFFKAFPSVKTWINESMKFARDNGYVVDIAGRRRRLPDIKLPKYKLKDNNKYASTFNPLLGAIPHVNTNTDKIAYYNDKLMNARGWKQIQEITNQAHNDNIEITDNTGFIAQAERQSVNARVQGGAATLTKYALLYIHRDPRMKEIGAKLINTVHDEILIEVPEEYAERAAELLVEDMINSAKDFVYNVPMSCDAYNVNAWYVDEYFSVVEKEFKNMLETMDPMQAFEKLAEERCESTRSQLYEIIGSYLPSVPEGVDVNYKSL